jgi:hypothetical protein
MPDTAKTWAEMRQKAFERNLMRSPLQPNMIEWIREFEHKNVNDAV